MPEEPQDVTPNPTDGSQDVNSQSNLDRQIDIQNQAPPLPTEPIFSQPTTAAAPISESMADQANSYYTTPKKSKKILPKGLMIALIAAVFIGGGSYAAYSWYENPQKVVTDSLMNIVTSKTSIYSATLTSEQDSDNKFVIDVTLKKPAEPVFGLDAKLTYNYQGESYVVKGAAQSDNDGNLYVKFDQLAELTAKVKDELAVGLVNFKKTTDAIDKLVQKIDGKWINISAKDLSDYIDDASETQTCTNDAIKKFQGDKNQIKEITDLYNDNQFIVVHKQLGLKSGKYDFMLKSDGAKLDNFVKGLSDTKIYKALHKCNSSFEISPDDIVANEDASEDGTIEVWIDMWSHQLTKINLESKAGSSKTSLMIVPQFNQNFKINKPSSSITLKQLESYLKDITDAYTQDVSAFYSKYDTYSDL